MLNLEGYRTIIAAGLTAIANLMGTAIEADVTTTGIINLVGLAITIYYRLKANGK